MGIEIIVNIHGVPEPLWRSDAGGERQGYRASGIYDSPCRNRTSFKTSFIIRGGVQMCTRHLGDMNNGYFANQLQRSWKARQSGLSPATVCTSLVTEVVYM